MTRIKQLHDSISGNVLCELILVDSERHELLAAYEHRRKSAPYPPMSLQIFVHNVRERQSVATVYIAHAADILNFAHQSSLRWLEEHIVAAYQSHRRERKKGHAGTT